MDQLIKLHAHLRTHNVVVAQWGENIHESKITIEERRDKIPIPMEQKNDRGVGNTGKRGRGAKSRRGRGR